MLHVAWGGEVLVEQLFYFWLKRLFTLMDGGSRISSPTYGTKAATDSCDVFWLSESLR